MDANEISMAREEREEFRNEIIAQNEIGNIQMDRRVMIFGFAALAVFLAGVGAAFFYDLTTGLLIIILSFAINIASHIRQVSSNVVKASRDLQLAILHMNEIRDDILEAIDKEKKE